ncbi:MAG: 2-oxoacid:ferredoxin oxidoreductase subunit beta [Chloroflexi bacterium]|nr:2-oxoacid:ferredoxin oxidoreductase subunit beta [Chloroflexota bacterium]
MAIEIATKRSPLDYKGQLKPIWCPGCGAYGVLSSLYRALTVLDLDPENVVIVSGIGCSSRIPGFVNAYGFHGVHGRALPLATGVKVANPALTVIAAGGDGDGLAIGGGHLPHAARRNVDFTYILMDNSVYGQTKGQSSPTSKQSKGTKSTPYGSPEVPLNPIAMALAYDASFVARGYSANAAQLTDLIVQGIRHRGFSFIQVISPCVTWNDTYKEHSSRVVEIPSEHDSSDKVRAFALALEQEKDSLGVFYCAARPTYEDTLAAIRQEARGKGAGGLEGLFDRLT